MAMTMMPRIGFSSSRVAYQQLVPDADTVAQWKSLVLCCRHPLVQAKRASSPGRGSDRVGNSPSWLAGHGNDLALVERGLGLKRMTTWVDRCDHSHRFPKTGDFT